MTDREHADHPFRLRVFVERDVSRTASGDDQLAECRSASREPSDLGMPSEDQDCFTDRTDVTESGLGIPLNLEIENAFEIDERAVVEDDHVMRRAFGRRGAFPSARCSR